MEADRRESPMRVRNFEIMLWQRVLRGGVSIKVRQIFIRSNVGNVEGG